MIERTSTMNITLWILQSVLALVFVGGGVLKLTVRRSVLEARLHMGWARDFSAVRIRAIGAAEVAGGLGLVLPLALHMASWLTATAAACLAVLMAGAASVHKRRHEPLAPPVVVALLAIIIGVGRWHW
jgi:hypothetical protein